jgi:hypothetical protein
MTIIEILAGVVVVQTALVCLIMWKMMKLERKQMNTIFGISHVWGAVSSLSDTLHPPFTTLKERVESGVLAGHYTGEYHPVGGVWIGTEKPFHIDLSKDEAVGLVDSILLEGRNSYCVETATGWMVFGEIGKAPKGPIGETDVSKMELPDAWRNRANDEEE